MPICGKCLPGAVIALLALLPGCAASPENPSLYSVKQPVVDRYEQSLDVATSAGRLDEVESRRLSAWFDRMRPAFGDAIIVRGAGADARVRSDIETIASRYGMPVSHDPVAGAGMPGRVRVTISRSAARIADCPDWSDKSGGSFGNGTGTGFGCAVNGNIAAMIADPAHLLEGAQTDGTADPLTITKAITTYREREPTGAKDLPDISSREPDE